MSAANHEINRTELVERLMSHPLYDELRDEESLQIFMRSHVFCVWDFQCLLKALQRIVTCVEVPWLPTADPEARRLVNEIVLDEESDEAPRGGHLSHFELYLQAMEECGADEGPIRVFLGDLRGGGHLREALTRPALPPGVAAFVGTTSFTGRRVSDFLQLTSLAFKGRCNFHLPERTACNCDFM